MKSAKIMVVEDERIVALHIRQQLEKLGYDVPSVVSDGQIALQRISEDRPDLILMDIRIDGDMDGIETASKVPAELNIPVIYLTAYSEEVTLNRARETRPHGYLLKPFSERELHATIQMALERSSAEARQKEEEEKTHQRQKLEAIGQLAGGVAHDFNNLLAIIQGNLELLRDEADTDELREMIGDALNAATRGSSLTRQLLAYSRRQPLTPRIIDLPRLVEDMTALLRRLIGETIEIQTRIPECTWKIRADQSQLESALLNLSVNARDAMPEGGRLEIACGNRDLEADTEAGFRADFQPGRYALLSISDSGVGMPAEILDQSTEPFFTTKPLGKGTGLGLSQVLGFVTQSKGNMRLFSTPGEGTRVELYFPAAEAAEETSPAASARPVSDKAREGETLLLVEDDDMVRKLVGRLLRSLGYEVIEAADGPEACAILDESPEISLLVTDLVLPKGMSGMDLMEHVRGSRPGLPVLFMSGYSAETMPSIPADVLLVQKPFRKEDIAVRLRELLDRAA
jgi:signal transduction histidine kinase